MQKLQKKQEEPKEPTKEEIVAALDSSKLVARSKLVTLKNCKKAVRITWYDEDGNELSSYEMENKEADAVEGFLNNV